MRIKDNTFLAGLAVAGLLTTTGVGTALAEQGSSEGPADHLVATKGDVEGPEPDEARIAAEKGLSSPTGFPVEVDLGTLVDVLKLDQEDLHSQIMAGKSLAEIAGEEKTPELIDAIVSANKERIESERAAGRLSDEEAADAVEDLREQVTELVNSEGPKGPPSVYPADGPESGG